LNSLALSVRSDTIRRSLIVQNQDIKNARITTTLSAPVVVPSLLVIGGLLLLCAVWPEEANVLSAHAQAWISRQFDWFYTLAVTLFLVFLIVVAASRFGDIRLGPDDAKPEFSFVSWTAMLFAAGMGIGLMYFGVGEPMQHYLKPPTALGDTPAATREAMLITFFHWGFHAWAVYDVIDVVGEQTNRYSKDLPPERMGDHN